MQLMVVARSSTNSEDYRCPIVVHSDLPIARKLFDSNNYGLTQTLSLGNIFMHMPIPTTEDTYDCEMLGVVIYSCSRWRSPGEFKI